MKELDKRILVLQQVGALLMVVGAAIFIWKPLWATVIYTVGTLTFCPIQMLQRYEGSSFTIRRLRRQQLLGLIAFLLAACCMIM